MHKFIFLFFFVLAFTTQADRYRYRYRKYDHVKRFYASIAKQVTLCAIKHNIPPAAILSIAGVESGYGRGYVARITGNILSLGAGKNDKQLPPLTLPSPKDNLSLVLYNPKEIAKYKKNELIYVKHPSSFKKDYRPFPYAGTKERLEYFDEHPQERIDANLKCVYDFCVKWISKKSRYKAFRNARAQMDTLVAKKGKEALFSFEAVKMFVFAIGGKKNSFNYRPSWRKKVLSVIKNIGLIKLCSDLYRGEAFEKSWYQIGNSISKTAPSSSL